MVESAIKAVESVGQNPGLSARAHSTPEAQDSSQAQAARKDREAEHTEAKRKQDNEPRVAPATHAVHLSTRVTLDSKTFQVYIQTVAEQPRAPVIHSYPPPPETLDPNRLIVLA